MRSNRLDQASLLKIAAMLVATPRYVGLMLYLSGFVFSGMFLSVLHIAEGVAGLSLAVLEGFALAYILSRRHLGFSRFDKIFVYVVVGFLLVLLPLCATPYLWALFNGSSLFTDSTSFWGGLFKFVWVAATASMPILIIIGVALVEKDPTDIAISLAEREATKQQTIAKIEAETEQALLQYKLQAKQIRTEHKQPTKQRQQKIKQEEQQGDFVCDYCGKNFASVKALAGHTGHCKVRAKQKNGRVQQTKEIVL